MKHCYSFFVCIAFAFFALASCSKDNPKVGETGAFLYAGTYFNTFQEAVDAVALSSADTAATITITKNVSDNGAVFLEKGIKGIVLDVQDKVYTLNSGKQISVGDNFFVITGNGGEIVSRGNVFSIVVGKEGGLRLS